MVEPAMVMTARGHTGAPAGEARPRATWRHRAEYAALATGLVVARIFPVSWVTGLAAALVGMAGPRLRQNRRALANLEIAFPEKTPAELSAIAQAMWRNMGRVFGEMLVLDRIMADPNTVTLADHDRWQTRMGEPGAAIACTLHAGSWELAAVPLVSLGRRTVGVYRPLGNPLVDDWLTRTRGALYPGGLLGKGDTNDDVRAGQRTARRLIDLARKGGTLCFVMDHYDRRGTPIAFLGREAKFTTAPAMIARHVSAMVWVGCCHRIGTSSRFRMEIIELDVPHSADKAADAMALTTAIFAQFEAWIRAHPEQWMWWNTRWVQRDRPE